MSYARQAKECIIYLWENIIPNFNPKVLLGCLMHSEIFIRGQLNLIVNFMDFVSLTLAPKIRLRWAGIDIIGCMAIGCSSRETIYQLLLLDFTRKVNVSQI